jgi:peptidoglycan/LPS O-acetylase OafA/YrhL
MKAARQIASEASGATVGRFEELEAYRGIAALLIVVFHAYQFSREGLGVQRYVYEGTILHRFFGNLDAGVAFFFALSGFLIFLPFARDAIEQRQHQSARGYLIRRAIRVAPLYYFAILFAWSLNYGGDRQQWLDLLEHLSFTQVFDNRHIFWDIGPAWSLSDELIFYLLVALVGAAAFRACARLRCVRSRVSALLACCAAIAGASVAYKFVAFEVLHVPLTNFAAYFGPLARVDSFAFGMIIAVLVAASGRPRLGRASALMLRLAGFGAIAYAFSTRSLDGIQTLYFHTICGLGVALIIASTALAGRELRWTRMLANRRLQLLGLVSYSLYIWHEPLMSQLARHHILINSAPHAFPLNALVLAVVSLGIACLSYWIIEYPAMQLRHLFTREGRWAEYYGPEGKGIASAGSTN